MHFKSRRRKKIRLSKRRKKSQPSIEMCVRKCNKCVVTLCAGNTARQRRLRCRVTPPGLWTPPLRSSLCCDFGTAAISAGRWQWRRNEVKNGALTLPRTSLSRCVRHATIFSWLLNTACCKVVGLGFGLWLGLDLMSNNNNNKRQLKRRSNMARVSTRALYNVRCSYSEYSQWSRNVRKVVLSMFLKVDNVGAERMCKPSGRLFQATGPTTQNTLVPGCSSVLGTMKPPQTEKLNSGCVQVLALVSVFIATLRLR